jgi:hypothetical protein
MNTTQSDTVRGWLQGRLPEGWFVATPEVTIDREEILILGRVAPPELDAAASAAQREAAAAGRIKAFREDTRERRIDIARELEHRFGKKVAWGVRCGDREEVFTSLSVPVMTRLRQPERVVLDTLVEAGVARSRSEALAWCVRLVGQHTADWLGQLRSAMEEVERVRAQGPGSSPQTGTV